VFEQNQQHDSGRPSFGELLGRAGLSGVPRTALIGAAVLVAVALGFVGWRLGGAAADGEFSFEENEAASAPVAEDGSDNPANPDSASSSHTLWVHVAGAVSAPGLYELPTGARVGDALDAAGGSLADAVIDAVNLARPLADGEQVYVPRADEAGGPDHPEAGTAPPGGGGSSDAAGAGVDINRASASELEALPGVGPATAEKIVSEREANGPFTSPEDLMRVPGIGEKKFEAMREMVVVR
jgi:competence protein ComEA